MSWGFPAPRDSRSPQIGPKVRGQGLRETLGPFSRQRPGHPVPYQQPPSRAQAHRSATGSREPSSQRGKCLGPSGSVCTEGALGVTATDGIFWTTDVEGSQICPRRRASLAGILGFHLMAGSLPPTTIPNGGDCLPARRVLSEDNIGVTGGGENGSVPLPRA